MHTDTRTTGWEMSRKLKKDRLGVVSRKTSGVREEQANFSSSGTMMP